MSESKPREFWIWKGYNKRTLDFTAQAQKPIHHEDSCIHVIEYSAYENLKDAYDNKCEHRNGVPPLCRAYADLATTYLNELEAERERNRKLCKALEALKEFLDELTVGPSPDAPTIVEVYIEPALKENGETK